MKDWTQCKKIKTAFVREVKGEKERVDTREGITWAYAATDFVMCGQDGEGKPDPTDVYPIKKDRWKETYELIENADGITLTMPLEDLFTIRRALDQYRPALSDEILPSTLKDEQIRLLNLIAWFHTDFGESP